jgi:hypothetical protein
VHTWPEVWKRRGEIGHGENLTFFRAPNVDQGIHAVLTERITPRSPTGARIAEYIRADDFDYMGCFFLYLWCRCWGVKITVSPNQTRTHRTCERMRPSICHRQRQPGVQYDKGKDEKTCAVGTDQAPTGKCSAVAERHGNEGPFSLFRRQWHKLYQSKSH